MILTLAVGEEAAVWPAGDEAEWVELPQAVAARARAALAAVMVAKRARRTMGVLSFDDGL
jgi:hypothetical protein